MARGLREDALRLKSEEKRLAILEAAKEIILERGYSATSMAEVSARVGGSKQTLYSYFASKEDLFIAVMLEKAATLVDPVFADLRAARDDLPKALRDFAIAFLRLVSTDEVLAMRRIIYAEGAKSTLGRRFYEIGPKRCWAEMAEELQRAMDEGRMRRADPWVASMHFSGLCEAGPYQQLLEGAIDALSEAEIVDIAAAAVDVFIRAYEVR
jgi:AcrR family transcriptional regulator